MAFLHHGYYKYMLTLVYGGTVPISVIPVRALQIIAVDVQ